MWRGLAAFAVVAVLGGACVSGAPLTGSGAGIPVVSADFPPHSKAATTQTAVLQVSNPGPADMDSLVVAFARAGDPELPAPIVDASAGGDNPSVSGVRPEPVGVSSDGVVYRFQGLEEGASTSITFELVVPADPGPAANAVQVYDGSDIERAAGVRLETTVER